MIRFKEFILEMDEHHKSAIARAHRGKRQSKSTRSKIASSMSGKQNRLGTEQSRAARDRISVKRGDYNPIGNKGWIVNSKGKTFRKQFAPNGFKLHKRKF